MFDGGAFETMKTRVIKKGERNAAVSCVYAYSIYKTSNCGKKKRPQCCKASVCLRGFLLLPLILKCLTVQSEQKIYPDINSGNI